MMKSRVFVLGAALALGAVGALTSVGAQDKGVIKIASQTPLSGPQSVLGDAIRNGIQLAVEEEGKSITAYGYRLVFQAEDDQATPNVGAANASRLINDADVLAVVGHLNSGVAIPSSEVYARVNLTMISPANTAEAITDRASTSKITNRVCGRDDVQGPAAADYTVNTLKAKRIFVINNKTAYGSGIAKNFATRARELGAQVIFETGVDEKDTDFSSVINRAKVDKPDAIFFGAIYNQAGLLIKQLREQGLETPIIGGDGYDASDLQKLAGAANLRKVFFTTTAGPISSLPATRTFAARYQAKFKKAPEGYSAYGYDAARVAIRAIAAALKANNGNKPSRAAVAAEVRKVTFAGITGQIAFNSRGDLKSAKYFVVQPDPSDYAKNKVVNVVDVKWNVP